MIAEQLQALIELQELDREIYLLKTERTSKPEALKAHRLELEDVQRKQDEAGNERDAFQGKHRLLEGELADHEQAAQKLEGQLGACKSNRDYQAMQLEIEGERDKKRAVEELILDVLEQIEQIEAHMAELQKEIDRKKARLDDEESRIGALVKELDEELAELEEQRVGLASPVDEETLTAYERLLNNLSGQALAAVEGQTCSGCYANMPLNLVNLLHIGKDFVSCPGCSRILYLR